MAAPVRLRGALPVGVVAGNHLAALHLRQLLVRHKGLQPLNLAELMGRSPRQRSKAVIVVDNGGLGIPLSWCLRRLQKTCSGARLLVLDADLLEPEIVRLLVLGANGFLAHSQVQDLLARAIHHVAKGGLWVSPSALNAFLTLASSGLRRLGTNTNELTEREIQVLELAKLRYSNREISETLRIQTSTVKFHMSNILSKLGRPNRRLLTVRSLTRAWEVLSLPSH